MEELFIASNGVRITRNNLGMVSVYSRMGSKYIGGRDSPFAKALGEYVDSQRSSASRDEEVDQGFTVRHPAGSGLWQASCIHAGCTWKGRMRVDRSNATAEGRGHRALTHPTPVGIDLAATPKEKHMRKRKDIEAEAKQLERRLSSLVDELAEIDSLPAEPGPDGTIVRFDVRFTPNGVSYSYAALKAKGAWWLTGREKGGRSWEEILEFMSQDWRITDNGDPIMFEVFNHGDGTMVTQETKR